MSDRYRLERELGAGGMATVYLAHDLKHHRPVAVKVLHAEHSAAVGKERFLREITTTANLTHPHIVPVFDSGSVYGPDKSGPYLFFVMPLIDGESLRARLEREGPLPIEEAIRLIREVADALEYAHSAGVLHRDLKPENIMLSRGHALLADFGIAGSTIGTSEHARLTQTGTSLGTPAYMSPEQATGERELGPPSDVYGLGSILYELLTGEAPFSGPTFEAILVKRFTQDAPRCSSRRADTPAGCDAAVAKALAREPGERFATVRAFAEAITTTPPSVTAPLAPQVSDRSIVVLPFANLSPDPDNEYFSDGLTEELITDLAAVKALRVISRASAQQLKGTTQGMREIGRTLGVRYVLTGGARKAGNALRITAQLTDTTTDQQVWAEKYSGTMDDVFDLQERVSRAIVGALRVTLSASESDRLADRPIKDARAFELYLRAQALVRRYGSSVDQVDSLIELAMAIEGPSLPLRALRGLLWVSQLRAGMSTDENHLSRAEAEARELIQLAPGSAYGFSLLGFVSYERGLMPETVRYLSQALERDPSDADALFFLGIALTAAGQIEAGLAAGRRFLEIDPLSSMAGVLFNSSHWFAGRPAEGLREHEHGLVLDPENPIIHWSLGYTYALLGQRDKARDRAAWMRARVPTMPYTVQLAALCEALDGRQAEALEILATIGEMSFDGHITFHLSESYAMAGDITSGLRLLEQGIERGFYPHEYIVSYCPFLAPLRSNPDFARIAARAAERVAEFAA
ncbi:MAG: protein kinase [Gemmatimonadales bacterium]